jgi:alginate O-acetyltransferase complex protein AlgJ
MNRRIFKGWRGEEIVAAAFVGGILLIGGATSLTSSRSVGRQALKGFQSEGPGATRISDRLRAATGAFENSFTECVCRKFLLSALDIHLRYFLTKEIASRQVLEGKDGWLFYKSKSDGDSMADYQGTNHLPDRKLDEIFDVLTRVKASLAARGIRLVILIPPNKEQIYANHMPDSVPKVEARSRADLLVEYLEQRGGLEIVYPKAEMLALRDRFPLYYEHDTHWNQLGAWIALQQMLEKLYGRREHLEDRQIEAVPASKRDLADLIHMAWRFDDDLEYRVLGSGETKRPGPDSLVLIGDSFQEALKPLLPEAFSSVLVVHRDDAAARLTALDKPDIVVLEWVERYVDLIPKVARIGWL